MNIDNNWCIEGDTNATESNKTEDFFLHVSGKKYQGKPGITIFTVQAHFLELNNSFRSLSPILK